MPEDTLPVEKKGLSRFVKKWIQRNKPTTKNESLQHSIPQQETDSKEDNVAKAAEPIPTHLIKPEIHIVPVENSQDVMDTIPNATPVRPCSRSSLHSHSTACSFQSISSFKRPQRGKTLKRQPTLHQQQVRVVLENDKLMNELIENFNALSVPEIAKKHTIKRRTRETIHQAHSSTHSLTNSQQPPSSTQPFGFPSRESEDEFDKFYDAQENSGLSKRQGRTTCRRKTTRFRIENETLPVPRPPSRSPSPCLPRRKTVMRTRTVMQPAHHVKMNRTRTCVRPDSNLVPLTVPANVAHHLNRVLKQDKAKALDQIVEQASEDDEFVDADDWMDQEEEEEEEENDNRFKRKKTIMVPRSFYETLASRAGEWMTVTGNAARVVSGPVAFLNPAMAGVISTGGAAAAAAGNAAVRKFGRKETRVRTNRRSEVLQKYTAGELLNTAAENTLGKTITEKKSMRMLTQGLSACLEGGIVAAGVTLAASAAATNLNADYIKKVEENSRMIETLGYLGNLEDFLPSSLQPLAAVAGHVATAREGLLSIHTDSDWTSDSE